MSKISLASLANLQNQTTAVGVINSNSSIIQTAFDNTLSRDGTTPNTMSANLDMNSNQILNLPSPGSADSPVRLRDVPSGAGVPISSVPPTGTSGAVVGFLNGNNTYSGTSTFTGTSTFSNTVTLPAQTVTGAQMVNNTITSTQITNNTIGNAQLRQGVARSIIGVAGNATANVADIQGTSRQVLSVNIGGNAISFASPQGDQLIGTITNDSATAGNVGEYIQSGVSSGSALALVTATPKTITSISLTAGDWDVWVAPIFLGGATTTVTLLISSISQVTNTLDTNFNNQSVQVFAGTTIFNTVANFYHPICLNRVSLSSTTTIFLVVQATFGTSTCSGAGSIQARRVR